MCTLMSLCARVLMRVQVQYGRLVQIRGQLALFAFHHVGSGNGTRVVVGSGQSLYP